MPDPKPGFNPDESKVNTGGEPTGQDYFNASRFEKIKGIYTNYIEERKKLTKLYDEKLKDFPITLGPWKKIKDRSGIDVKGFIFNTWQREPDSRFTEDDHGVSYDFSEPHLNRFIAGVLEREGKFIAKALSVTIKDVIGTYSSLEDAQKAADEFTKQKLNEYQEKQKRGDEMDSDE
ncbi:MAG: hypothetical protein HY569_01845 [Candidatus Magasanikbacteria bacterium]|nr:hypothetical protein [Candidatus Magasanikbacteria bacterium]